MSKLLDSLLTPAQRAQAERIDAAMMQLSGLLAERAVLETATAALDASRRAAFEAMTNDSPPRRAFDPDYGSFTGHPMDPRTEASEDVDDMLAAISEAEAALKMARDALEGYGNKVSTLTARSLMNEARDYLESA